jgi:hypothetical protein
MDTSCTLCEDNDETRKVGAIFVCLQCEDEHLCHRCMDYNPTACEALKRCISCNLVIRETCGCMALTWCQTEECICRGCVADQEITCDTCDQNAAFMLTWGGREVFVVDGDKPLFCGDCFHELAAEPANLTSE